LRPNALLTIEVVSPAKLPQAAIEVAAVFR
jgi:hypothetical protein